MTNLSSRINTLEDAKTVIDTLESAWVHLLGSSLAALGGIRDVCKGVDESDLPTVALRAQVARVLLDTLSLSAQSSHLVVQDLVKAYPETDAEEEEPSVLIVEKD